LRRTVLTVDNGINAQSAVRLARRLGVEVIVIDHHRVLRRADTLAVWAEEFCGAGLAAASDPEAAKQRSLTSIDSTCCAENWSGITSISSGRSGPGFDLEHQLKNFAPLLDRFGGHAQAIGLTLRVDRIGELCLGLESACRGLARRREPQADSAVGDIAARLLSRVSPGSAALESSANPTLTEEGGERLQGRSGSQRKAAN
jgi:hypothetical protein